jgi:diaminopimelate epimerase
LSAHTIPFWKLESVGNDFVLVHLTDVGPASLPELAIRVCSRHFGIGSDGLLVLRETGRQSFQLRMFNPDGTEDFCGNGLRCAFVHAADQGWITTRWAEIVHMGQVVKGELDTNELGDRRVSYKLRPASYEPAQIPIHRAHEAFDTLLFTIDGKEYRGSVLSTGSAHTVIPVEELPDDEEFLRASPQIEHHAMFPERTSIMWTEQVGEWDLKLRIWERGAGETYGCGTGSLAAAIDFLRRKGKGGSVAVHNPGGTLRVSAPNWNAESEMSGIAHETFRGDLVL